MSILAVPVAHFNGFAGPLRPELMAHLVGKYNKDLPASDESVSPEGLI